MPTLCLVNDLMNKYAESVEIYHHAMCHFFDTMLLAKSLLGYAISFGVLLVICSSHYRIHLFHDSILPTQRPVAERVVCVGYVQCPVLWSIFDSRI